MRNSGTAKLPSYDIFRQMFVTVVIVLRIPYDPFTGDNSTKVVAKNSGYSIVRANTIEYMYNAKYCIIHEQLRSIPDLPQSRIPFPNLTPSPSSKVSQPNWKAGISATSLIMSNDREDEG